MRRALAIAIGTLLALSAPAFAAKKWSGPSVAEAEKSLASGDLDTVYLAFGAIKPGQHPDGDSKVSALLAKAALLAAKNKDWALVTGLASKARELDSKNTDACEVEADAAIALNNRGEAEQALDDALKIAPHNWALVLKRARLARQEGDIDIAISLLESIPATAAEAADAKKEHAIIDKKLKDAEDAMSGKSDSESDPTPPRPQPGPPGTMRGPKKSPGKQEPSESGVPGYASRTSQHFKIVYSEGGRDFGGKAEYEQQCLDLLERAYAKVEQKLGTAVPHPTDVVLYTRAEFELHFGSVFGNSLLGFYEGKIRMNRADTIDTSFFDTAVHEYTHAVIDSMAEGGRIPTWVHEGLAKWVERTSAGREPAEAHDKQLLRNLNRQGKLPTIATMADRPIGTLGDGYVITAAYEKSALAIDIITKAGSGLVGLERVIRNSRGGFDAAFAAEFGSGRMAMLDKEVAKQFE